MVALSTPPTPAITTFTSTPITGGVCNNGDQQSPDTSTAHRTSIVPSVKPMEASANTNIPLPQGVLYKLSV